MANQSPQSVSVDAPPFLDGKLGLVTREPMSYPTELARTALRKHHESTSNPSTGFAFNNALKTSTWVASATFESSSNTIRPVAG